MGDVTFKKHQRTALYYKSGKLEQTIINLLNAFPGGIIYIQE